MTQHIFTVRSKSQLAQKSASKADDGGRKACNSYWRHEIANSSTCSSIKVVGTLKKKATRNENSSRKYRFFFLEPYPSFSFLQKHSFGPLVSILDQLHSNRRNECFIFLLFCSGGCELGNSSYKLNNITKSCPLSGIRTVSSARTPSYLLYTVELW